MRKWVAVNDDDINRILGEFQRDRESVHDLDVTTHADLGLAYLEMGLLPDAEAEFSRVLKLEPTHQPARTALELIKQER